MNRRSALATATALSLFLAACSSEGGAAGEPSSSTAPPVTSAPAVSEPAGTAEDFDPAELETNIETFLETTSTSNAQAVVASMSDSGDQRYVAWLVDLLRLGVSNRVDGEVSSALQALTGIEATGVSFDDANRFGSLQATEAIEPGDGYRTWKVSLYERLDPEFAPLLESVETNLELSRVHFGGVPRAGIPELNEPDRVAASDAVWMTDDELVMGLVIDGEAIAYPLRIILHHELVNDTIAGEPISLVYCTLCRTGLVFNRSVDEVLLEFETSGLLENSNKIMVDRETDTLWHHLEGEAFAGSLRGTVLEQYPVVTITWAEWVAEQPETAVLTIPDPIYFDDPERPPLAYSYEPGDAYSSYYSDEEVWFPILDTPAAFPIKDEVIGISDTDGSGDSLAVHLPSIAGGPPRWFTVGDRSLIVAPTSAGARVYDASELDPSTVIAGQIDGEVDGGLEDGAKLDETLFDERRDDLPIVVAEQSFWFAWWSNNQNTRVWDDL